MRHELIIQKDAEFIDLRGIFTDLLTLSKKDGGYIRANENTPYPLEQLAGMFCVPIARLEQCIEICLRPEVGKLRKFDNGVLYVPSHDNYELSERQKRRIELSDEEMSATPDAVAEKAESKGKERKGKERKGKKIKDRKCTTVIVPLFEDPILQLAWEEYRQHRMERKKPLTPLAEQKAAKLLHELSQGNTQTALQIINQTIANGWLGLFELKGNNGTTHTGKRAIGSTQNARASFRHSDADIDRLREVEESLRRNQK